MYFLFCSLSFNDICLSTITIPNMLVKMQTQDNSITYIGFLSKVCIVIIFVCMENCLLAVVANDSLHTQSTWILASFLCWFCSLCSLALWTPCHIVWWFCIYPAQI
jgi:hypothetical protein